MTGEAVPDILRRGLSTLREQYGVEEPALFGSFAASRRQRKRDGGDNGVGGARSVRWLPQ